jgi:hypothetical protein
MRPISFSAPIPPRFQGQSYGECRLKAAGQLLSTDLQKKLAIFLGTDPNKTSLLELQECYENAMLDASRQGGRTATQALTNRLCDAFGLPADQETRAYFMNRFPRDVLFHPWTRDQAHHFLRNVL